ncbi:MAG TPA: hypothetical protein VF142_09305 [Longimicrobium sp.]
MSDLKTTRQGPGNTTSGDTPPGTHGEKNQGQEFGARRPGTAGTDRDLDRSGESKNQGHGHPRQDRGDD